MKFFKRTLASTCAALIALVFTGCGGGSSSTGGGGTQGATAFDTTPTLSLAYADSFTATTLRGSGTGSWSGDGSNDSGNSDGAGAAGDGEFVGFQIKFPNATSTTGTITWKVLASQYGIKDQTGTLTITRELTAGGGYKVVNPSTPNQANFMVSFSGQISGTFPLTINGVQKDVLFNGVRYMDSALVAATDPSQAFAEIAGIYGFAGLAANAGSGSNADTNGGFLQFNADGSARICPNAKTPAEVSSTCTGGGNVTLAFNDPTKRDVIKLTSADLKFNAYALVHKFSSTASPNNTGVSLTIDYNAINSSGIRRTGAIYASRVPSTAIAAAEAIGAWSLMDVHISNPGNSNATSTKKNGFIAIKDIAGTVKVRPSTATSCGATTLTLTQATGINGALQLNAPASSDISYLIMMDQDSGVLLQPFSATFNDTGITLVRRYSTDPTVLSTCQPQ